MTVHISGQNYPKGRAHHGQWSGCVVKPILWVENDSLFILLSRPQFCPCLFCSATEPLPVEKTEGSKSACVSVYGMAGNMTSLRLSRHQLCSSSWSLWPYVLPKPLLFSANLTQVVHSALFSITALAENVFSYGESTQWSLPVEDFQPWTLALIWEWTLEMNLFPGVLRCSELLISAHTSTPMSLIICAQGPQTFHWRA